MKYLKIIVGVIIFAGISLVALTNYIFESHGTSLAFISSDGKWTDREILFKGREFKGVVYLFEVYKIQCNAPNVTLERLRSKSEWYSVSALFDKKSDAKWKVPLSSTFLYVASGFALPEIEAIKCYTNEITEVQEKQAELAAQRYVESLQ